VRIHARGRITKSVKKKDAEDVVMVASEMRRFWKVYDKEGIWRGDIEVIGLFWLFAVGLRLDMVGKIMEALRVGGTRERPVERFRVRRARG